MSYSGDGINLSTYYSLVWMPPCPHLKVMCFWNCNSIQRSSSRPGQVPNGPRETVKKTLCQVVSRHSFVPKTHCFNLGWPAFFGGILGWNELDFYDVSFCGQHFLKFFGVLPRFKDLVFAARLGLESLFRTLEDPQKTNDAFVESSWAWRLGSSGIRTAMFHGELGQFHHDLTVLPNPGPPWVVVYGKSSP